MEIFHFPSLLMEVEKRDEDEHHQKKITLKMWMTCLY